MQIHTLADIERAFRESWGADTADPVDVTDWHPGNPTRGQCGVTALVLSDLLGGDLVMGEVHRGAERVGVHYWNRLSGGTEIDLTREQFFAEESVSAGTVVTRPPVRPGAAPSSTGCFATGCSPLSRCPADQSAASSRARQP